MHSSVIGKIEKANRYARERDRITVDRIAVTFQGDNDTHRLSLDADGWQCNCHYFESWQPARTSWPCRRSSARCFPRMRRRRSSLYRGGRRVGDDLNAAASQEPLVPGGRWARAYTAA